MPKNTSPFVSVVTPVYNGERYIDGCVQSVRSQTFENWEYVIVDNCSSDGTGDIVQKHAAEDGRIRVVRPPEHLSMIQNHNFALRQMSSESRYCKIVHADDKLLPACLELMVAVGEQHPSASIVGSYSLRNAKVVSDGIPLDTSLVPGKELSRQTLLRQLYCFWSPSGLLLRSASVRERGNFYNGDHLHADVEACYELLQTSDFAFVHQVLTFIRHHEASTTSRVTRSYNKIILSNLDLFLRFGPLFLSQEEYQSELKVRTRMYYRFLGDSVLSFRERGFWRYHEETCRAIGFPLRWSRLAGSLLLRVIGEPVPTMKKLAQVVSRA